MWRNNLMLKYEELQDGSLVWYSYVEMSKNKSRIIRKVEPICIRLKLTEDGTGFLLYDAKDGQELRNLPWGRGKITDWTYNTSKRNPKFYKTKEEVVEEWNKVIYDSIDYMQSKLDALKKKLITRD